MELAKAMWSPAGVEEMAMVEMLRKIEQESSRSIREMAQRGEAMGELMAESARTVEETQMQRSQFIEVEMDLVERLRLSDLANAQETKNREVWEKEISMALEVGNLRFVTKEKMGLRIRRLEDELSKKEEELRLETIRMREEQVLSSQKASEQMSSLQSTIDAGQARSDAEGSSRREKEAVLAWKISNLEGKVRDAARNTTPALVGKEKIAMMEKEEKRIREIRELESSLSRKDRELDESARKVEEGVKRERTITLELDNLRDSKMEGHVPVEEVEKIINRFAVEVAQLQKKIDAADASQARYEKLRSEAEKMEAVISTDDSESVSSPEFAEADFFHCRSELVFERSSSRVGRGDQEDDSCYTIALGYQHSAHGGE